MNVTETSADGLKREYRIVVDKDEIEGRIAERLAEIGKTIKLPGFRPGKVPPALLRKRFGDSVRGEVLERAVADTSSQTLAEREVRPALRPQIEIVSFEEGGDLEYTLAVEVLPEIEPSDLKAITLTREVAKPTEEEVDAAVARLAAREKNYLPVEEDRPAEKGDALLIDFVGSIEGVPFEGGSATDHLLELGANAFIEGFEDQLIGARAGEHRTVKVTFPADYPNPELAGKEATFEVDVKEIQKVEPVPVDDAFAQSLGFENLEALRTAVREQIERDYANISRSKLKRQLLDALAASHDFPVPEGMVEAEFGEIWKRIEEDREKGRLDADDVGRDEDELKAEYRAIAERRVRLGLLLSEIGRRNEIEVGQDEIARAVMERARAFPGQENQVVEFFRENPQALEEVKAPLYEDKVIDFILEMANVSERPVTVEELMREPDEEGEESEQKKAGKKATKAAKKPAKPAKKATKKASKDATKDADKEKETGGEGEA